MKVIWSGLIEVWRRISHLDGRKVELVACDVKMELLTYNCGEMTSLASSYGEMKELVASDCGVRKVRLKLISLHCGVKMGHAHLACAMRTFHHVEIRDLLLPGWY